MKRILFILFFLLVSRNYPQTWVTQNSGVSINLNDVCFVDTLFGWVVGDSATILSTSDGGNNWRRQISPVVNKQLFKVQFKSRNTGYILGSDNTMLCTRDGGNNWFIVSHGFDNRFRDLSFINEYEGWVAGYKTYSDHGVSIIAHTTNGGLSWEKQLEIISQSPFGAILFRTIKFQDEKNGWTTSIDEVDTFSPTFIYKTEDGGKSWSNISSVRTGILSLKIANRDTLWGGGESFTNFAISFNKGITWQIPQNKYNIAVELSPESGLKGWICYYKFLSGENKRILYTTDAGNTWKEELQLDATISAMDNKCGNLWIVGANGLIMKRKPLATLIDNPYIIPPDFKLHQNYPNPFNSGTIIKYKIPSAGYVTLKVFDAAGKEIKVLVSGFKQAGDYQLECRMSRNGASVTSGVYFYTLNVTPAVNTQERVFQETRKMILLR